jgi:hypothetical protein
MNFGIQSSNYDNPIVYFPASFFTSTSSTYSKIMTLTMEDTELLTHSSLVGYAEPHSQKLTKVKNFNTDITYIDNDSNKVVNLLTAYIRMDRVKTQINRKYQMIYQYVAEFGGLFQTIGILAFIVTYKLSKTHFKVDLLKNTIEKNDALDIITKSPNGKLIVVKKEDNCQVASLHQLDHVVPKVQISNPRYNQVRHLQRKAISMTGKLDVRESSRPMILNSDNIVNKETDSTPRGNRKTIDPIVKLDNIKKVNTIESNNMPVENSVGDGSLPKSPTPNFKSNPSNESQDCWQLNSKNPPQNHT